MGFNPTYYPGGTYSDRSFKLWDDGIEFSGWASYEITIEGDDIGAEDDNLLFVDETLSGTPDYDFSVRNVVNSSHNFICDSQTILKYELK